MEIMHQTDMRWLIVLGLLSWAATAVGAEPETDSREIAIAEPVPIRITDGPAFAPATHHGSGDKRSILARWWQDRAKPRLQYCYWGYPEEFEETPLGASVRAHKQAQICSAWSARLFLYQYDFCDGGTTLNPHGQQRLNEMMAAFPIWAHHQLMIESTPDKPRLALARREHVMCLLTNAGIPAHVEVGVPTAFGRLGEEARTMNVLLIDQMKLNTELKIPNFEK